MPTFTSTATRWDVTRVLVMFFGVILLSGCDISSRVQYSALLAKAGAGDADAQVRIARQLACPNYGCAWGPWMPTCDDQKCHAFLAQAAEQGSADAQFWIAESYNHTGYKICRSEKNTDKAIEWYLRAAAQNHQRAAYMLVEIYKQRGMSVEAAKWQNLADSEPTRIEIQP